MLTSASTLVDTDPSESYQQWMIDSGIKQKLVGIAPNKDGNVATTVESICEAVLFAMDSANHPLYIHCNQGKHRTGCVVACLRKIEGMPMQDIIDEYRTYSGAKWRIGDIEFIMNFDPEAVFEYAKAQNLYDGSQPRIRRLRADLTSLDTLAAALAKQVQIDSAIGSMQWISSSESSTSDEQMEVDETMESHGVVEMIDDKTEHVQSEGPTIESMPLDSEDDDGNTSASSGTPADEGILSDDDAASFRSLNIDPRLIS
jgi:tyrosine-protein phosphatase SIW14